MRNIILAIFAGPILFGCLSAEDSFSSGGNGGDGGDTAGNQPGNSAPTIAGSPAASTMYNEGYDFLPNANDADGDTLTFDVQNRPTWANFDVLTGRLYGQPSLADIGVYNGIIISVSDDTHSASLPVFSVTVVQTAAGNSAPTISGSPATSTTYNEGYDFLPNANDADGDTLTFDVQNRPTWANFDVLTGRLYGQPSLADIGVYNGIIISVSDDTHSASLPVFSVTVVQTAEGVVTLSWVAPTENSDGSPLMDLAGYKIYYRKNSGPYEEATRIDNPGVTTFVVEQLSPATYYFAATAFNLSGVESSFSSEVARTVQ